MVWSHYIKDPKIQTLNKNDDDDIISKLNLNNLKAKTLVLIANTSKKVTLNIIISNSFPTWNRRIIVQIRPRVRCWVPSTMSWAPMFSR